MSYLNKGNYFLRVPINRIETSKYPAIMTKVQTRSDFRMGTEFSVVV